MSTYNTANYEQLLSDYLVGRISLEKFQAQLDGVAKTEGLDLNDYIRAGLEERTRLLSSPSSTPTFSPQSIPGDAKNTVAAQPQTPIVPGYTLKKRFVLEEQIGEGGMSIVFRARDLRLVEAKVDNPYVAIKILREALRDKPEFNQALQLEADNGRRLSHPNIVKIYDLDRDGDVLFIVMEHINGQRLDQILNDPGYKGVSSKRAMRVVQAMSDALKHAHAHGIIHADFKPGNIFVTDKREIKVFDFGVAQAKRSFDTQSNADQTLFDIGRLGAVTPAYATIEILAGKEADFRDDIYALACISYQIFTSEHPYQRKDAKEALAKNLKSKYVKGLSTSQWTALQHGLALERSKRTQTVEHFNDQLQNVGQKKRLHSFTTIALAASWVAVVVIVAGLLITEFGQKTKIEYVEIEVPKIIQIEPEALDPRMENVVNSPQRLNDYLANPQNTQQWNQDVAKQFALVDAIYTPEDPEGQNWHQQAAEIYWQRAEQAAAENNWLKVRENLHIAKQHVHPTAVPEKYQTLAARLNTAGQKLVAREAPITLYAFDSVKQEFTDQLIVGAVTKANRLLLAMDHSLQDYRQYFSHIAPQLLVEQGLRAAKERADQGLPRDALKIVNDILFLQPATLELIEMQEYYQTLVDGAT